MYDMAQVDHDFIPPHHNRSHPVPTQPRHTMRSDHRIPIRPFRPLTCSLARLQRTGEPALSLTLPGGSLGSDPKRNPAFAFVLHYITYLTSRHYQVLFSANHKEDMLRRIDHEIPHTHFFRQKKPCLLLHTKRPSMLFSLLDLPTK